MSVTFESNFGTFLSVITVVDAQDDQQVLPKVIWEECVATPVPQAGECTVALRVLAVQCTTLQNRYGTLRKHYGTVVDRYRTSRNVTGALWSRCKTLQGVMDALRKCYRALWSR